MTKVDRPVSPIEGVLWAGIWLSFLAFAAIVLLLGLCRVASAQTEPDHTKTPGVATELTARQICSTKWLLRSKGVDDAVVTVHSKRGVSKSMKARVFALYGISCKTGKASETVPSCRSWEIDHLIPRSIGGADNERNLWPQVMDGPMGARIKDVLEHKIKRDVCAGRLDLKQAQQDIAADWQAMYRKMYSK